MKDLLELIGLVAGVLLLLALIFGWEVYAFRDCRKVGHSFWYCVGRIES